MNRIPSLLSIVAMAILLSHCGHMGSGNMGGPTIEARQAAIAAEPGGDHYIGRRYFVHKTRFWGYVRKPNTPWKDSQLVIVREDRKRQPDRLPEYGSGKLYGYDQNYEYKLSGYYTGKKAYDPNSNQVLPEFMLTGYEVLNRQPGWLFRPDDRYDPYRITLVPR